MSQKLFTAMAHKIPRRFLPRPIDHKFTVETFPAISKLGVECYYYPYFLSEYHGLSESMLSSSLLELEIGTIKLINEYACHDESVLSILLQEFPFRQEKTVARFRGYDEVFDQPRLTRLMGDGDAQYYYSGEMREKVPWIPAAKDLRDMVMNTVLRIRPSHPNINIVLGNLYNDGTRYIARHSDNEDLLEAFIASLSLGSERDFDVWNKTTKQRIERVALKSGSLFLMGRKFQQCLQHDLPKRLKVKTPRINLTFRCTKIVE